MMVPLRSPEASVRPAGLKARLRMTAPSLWSVSGAPRSLARAGSATSQRRTVLSSLPDASRRESALKARPVTQSVCPTSV